jgi:hypothetical protein
MAKVSAFFFLKNVRLVRLTMQTVNRNQKFVNPNERKNAVNLDASYFDASYFDALYFDASLF